MSLTIHPAHGRTRHVAVRCDEEDGHTWDVWRFGRVVAAGYLTRERARTEARRLDQVEQGRGPLPVADAHRLADAACEARDYELALRLLQRASDDRHGGRGVLADVRTANRILNIKERVRGARP